MAFWMSIDKEKKLSMAYKDVTILRTFILLPSQKRHKVWYAVTKN